MFALWLIRECPCLKEISTKLFGCDDVSGPDLLSNGSGEKLFYTVTATLLWDDLKIYKIIQKKSPWHSKVENQNVLSVMVATSYM